MQGKQRSYKEIMNDVQKANYGKEMRGLHKELKERGDGLPLFMRYPHLPDIAIAISTGLLLLSLATRLVISYL